MSLFTEVPSRFGRWTRAVSGLCIVSLALTAAVTRAVTPEDDPAPAPPPGLGGDDQPFDKTAAWNAPVEHGKNAGRIPPAIRTISVRPADSRSASPRLNADPDFTKALSSRVDGRGPDFTKALSSRVDGRSPDFTKALSSRVDGRGPNFAKVVSSHVDGRGPGGHLKIVPLVQLASPPAKPAHAPLPAEVTDFRQFEHAYTVTAVLSAREPKEFAAQSLARPLQESEQIPERYRPLRRVKAGAVATAESDAN